MTGPSFETGTILDVEQVTLGSELTADTASGVTTLTVDDASDYDAEDGGTCSINGTLYVYTVEDVDNGVLTITPGLTAAASDGDRVDVWDTVNDIAATWFEVLVELPGDDDVDATPARLAAALVPTFTHKLGIRDAGTGETCTLQLQGDEWVVVEVPGDTVQLDGAVIKPDTIPETSLGFTLDSGAHVTVSTTAPASPAVDDIWLDAANGNTLKQWDGTTWQAYQFGTAAIAAGSITSDLIAADAIIAGQIATGALDAYSINAASLSAATMSGHVVGSDLSGSDFLLDSDGGRAILYEQTPSIAASSTTPGTYTYTVPSSGVSVVKLEGWGGGGVGGSGTAVSYMSGGGGGGEYACEPLIAVSPGDVLTYTVPNGGTGTSGQRGADAIVKLNGVEVLRAHGGVGTQAVSPPGAGGFGSTNTIHFDGGAGGRGPGGGGGSSAGTKAVGRVGGAGSTGGSTGGSAPSGGGSGGSGGVGTFSTPTAGTAGAVPGGGGGGGNRNASSGNTSVGGAGAAGKVQITTFVTTLVASMASVSGTTDAYGNAIPVGVKVQRQDLAGMVGGYAREWSYTLTSVASSGTYTFLASNGTNVETLSDYPGALTSGIF
ncbi:MAG TPA: hypothetical protein VGH43_11940, partial [Jatrophihabitans sp.]